MPTKEELLKEIEAMGPTSSAQPAPVDDLSMTQRLILQNLFDTGSQKERRKAYFDKLGFEMNPKDPNQYKPKGSSSAFREVDPGIGAYKSMLSEGAFGKMAKEFVQDSGDILYDAIVSAPAQTAGAAGGAATLGAAGTAATAGLGAPASIAMGAIMGGAAGNVAAEGLKTKLGDLLIDPNVPVDKQDLLLESAISGLMPEALKGVAKTAPAVYLKQAARSSIARLGALKNTISELGTLEKPIIEDVFKNPWNYTKEKLGSANKYLTKNFENFFGIAENSLERPKDINGVPSASVIGKVLEPLKTAQKKELDLLDKNPNAAFKYSDIIDFLNQAKGQLEGIPGDQRSSEIDSAIGYLNDRLRKTFDQAKKIDPNIETLQDVGRNPKLQKSFSDMKQMLESVQSDIFQSEIPGGSVLKQIFGGSDTGLRTIMDNKAASVGSALPQINSRLSQGLQLYNDAADIMKPNRLRNAFSKTQTDEKVLVNRVLDQISDYTKQTSTMVDNLASQRGYKLDNKIPVEDFLNDFRSDAMAANVQNILETGAPISRKQSFTEGLTHGASKAKDYALTAAGVGAMTGQPALAKVGVPVAGMYGFAKGFKEGRSLSDPRQAATTLIDTVQGAAKNLGDDRMAALARGEVDAQLGQGLNETLMQRAKAAPGRLLSDVGTSAAAAGKELYGSPAINLRSQLSSTEAAQPVDAAIESFLDNRPKKKTKEEILKEIEAL